MIVERIFEVTCKDSNTSARVGRLNLGRASIETPVFMPVGTQATVKSVAPWELEGIGYRLMLSNTYHLYMRPGPQYFEKYPDLHKFMNWSFGILTDSGGYQVFSLAKLRKVSKEGVWFSSHIDGKKVLFTPEEVIRFQLLLNSDILMPLDECLEYPVSKKRANSSLNLTIEWAGRSLTYWRQSQKEGNILFGIVQGATYPDLRERAVVEMTSMNFPGYAIGGVSVGEPARLRWEVTQLCCSLLPENKPRYLMGVGKPEDIVKAVGLGVDMFDCVIPTRYGRTGLVFTWEGELNLRNSRFKEDLSPIDESCPCPACRGGFSRSYIRYLLYAKEILGVRLLTLHNLYFYFDLMVKIREAIKLGRYREFVNRFMEARLIPKCSGQFSLN